MDYNYEDGEASDLDDVESTHGEQNNYRVLSPDDIRRRLEEDITKVSTVLSVSKAEATTLLVKYDWDVNRVCEAWSADGEDVLGLLEEATSCRTKVACGICAQNVAYGEMRSIACGHPFCSACWRGYVSASINKSSGCLRLRCPEPSCGAAVGRDMIDALVSEEDKSRYSHYLLKSYVDKKSDQIKWCPAPACFCAVEFENGSGSGSGRGCDVTCSCMYSFCWNCSYEAHRPVDCNAACNWILKTIDESESETWILANTKCCSKCNCPIEKTHDFMHVRCPEPCGFEFCWLCLAEWTGFNHTCNSFDREKEGENKRSVAKKSLDRYTYCFERWSVNELARQNAIVESQRMESVCIKELSKTQYQTEANLEFISVAWRQIIKCRRVLKWTYAYQYNLSDEEHKKRELFEYLQGQAEEALEQLHKCAENDLQGYLKKADAPAATATNTEKLPSQVPNVKVENASYPEVENAPNPEVRNTLPAFYSFRAKLINLTSVTRNYFENLVQALENGLVDVNSFGDKGEH